MEEEIKLEFGNVSNPVKVGDTVRRDTGPWTPTIHALLDFLQSNEFHAAPKALGIDKKGRESLSYLEGAAAVRPWRPNLLTSDGPAQAAKLLRRYHDIVINFVPDVDAEWRVGKVPMKPGQIIRHGDLGPWNTIWKDDILTGIIDWDFACPGDRIEDLAQLAYYFAPLRGDTGWKDAGFTKEPNVMERLQTITDAYGMFTPEEIIKTTHKILLDDMDIVNKKGSAGIEPWVSFLKRGDVQEIQHDLEWLRKLNAD